MRTARAVPRALSTASVHSSHCGVCHCVWHRYDAHVGVWDVTKRKSTMPRMEAMLRAHKSEVRRRPARSHCQRHFTHSALSLTAPSYRQHLIPSTAMHARSMRVAASRTTDDGRRRRAHVAPGALSQVQPTRQGAHVCHRGQRRCGACLGPLQLCATRTARRAHRRRHLPRPRRQLSALRVGGRDGA
jgi:hypothetical protein